MSQKTYLKIPFVWEEALPLIEITYRLKFEPVKALSNEVFISALAQLMSSSIDASNQKAVLEYGARQAAEKFINESKDGFSYQHEWWQFGSIKNDSEQEIVGLVLPVIYQGCAKDNLEEGTIYYIGVLPKYRGLGLAKDLLLKGTRILQEVGVWRVFCDTALNNLPMISTFKRVGYQQHGEPWKRPI